MNNTLLLFITVYIFVICIPACLLEPASSEEEQQLPLFTLATRIPTLAHHLSVCWRLKVFSVVVKATALCCPLPDTPPPPLISLLQDAQPDTSEHQAGHVASSFHMPMKCFMLPCTQSLHVPIHDSIDVFLLRLQAVFHIIPSYTLIPKVGKFI